MRKLLTILIALTLVSACACDPVYVPTITKVPILPEPVLPKLTSIQANSIPQDAYDILRARDITWKAHVERINKILKQHNEDKTIE